MNTRLPERNAYLNRLAPTPLIAIQLDDAEPAVWCKLEFLNPSGSTKDRIARHILEKAWLAGFVGPRSVVVEAARRLGSGAQVVTVFPDGTERYFTTELFAPMKEV